MLCYVGRDEKKEWTKAYGISAINSSLSDSVIAWKWWKPPEALLVLLIREKMINSYVYFLSFMAHIASNKDQRHKVHHREIEIRTASNMPSSKTLPKTFHNFAAFKFKFPHRSLIYLLIRSHFPVVFKQALTTHNRFLRYPLSVEYKSPLF